MNKIRESLSGFLTKTKRKHLQRTAAGLMAAAVAISVYGSLIRPAISMTAGTRLLSAAAGDTEVTGTALAIGKADTSSDTGVYAVDAIITKDNNATPTKYYTELTAKFNLTAEVVQSLSEHNNSITFNVMPTDSSGNVVTSDFNFESATTATGDVYTSGTDKSKIGTYVFEPSTGKVDITFDFTAPYFNGRQNEAIGGGFNFKAWTWNENNSKEDKSFKIAQNDVLVPIYRYNNHADLDVDKSYNNDFFYETEGEAMGTGKQAKRSMGSSFTIKIASKNGVDGGKVTFTDTLTSDNVHFDLKEGGSFVPQIVDKDGKTVEDVHLVIDSVSTVGDQEVLVATLVADNEQVLNRGFEYYWKCPCTVNEEHIKNGEVSVTSDFNELYGTNKVEAKAKDVTAVPDDATLQVGLVADITKSNGTYNPETNTVHWRISVHKNNGWWQNGKITIDDFMGGDGTKENHGSKLPDVKNITMSYDTVDDKGNPTGNHVYDSSKSAADNNGISSVGYSDGKFVIEMVKPTTGLYTNYNEQAVSEFVIEYDTPVTSDDYGKTEFNWVGLESPDDPTDYVRIDPDKYVTVSKPEIDKDHTLTDNGIKWTVTIDNSKLQNLTGLKITDTLTGDEAALPAFSNDNVLLKVGGVETALDSVFTVDGSTLTFKEGQKAASYELVYTQQLDLSDHKGSEYTNEVKIENDNGPIDEDTEKAHIPKQFEVEKTGYLGTDGLVHYKVSFINQYGDNIGGQTIVDTLSIRKADGSPANASDFIINVTPVSGITVTGPQSGENGLITTNFTVDGVNHSKRIDIEYTLRPVSGDFRTQYGYNLYNTAEWGDEKASVPVDVKKLVQLESKDGSYDKSTDLITWTVRINNEYKVDLSTFPDSTTPYTVTDNLFNDKLVSFKITDANGADCTNDGDLANVRSSRAYSFHTGMTSEYYTLTYQTKLPDPEPLVNNKIEVKNTVNYAGDEKEKTVTVNPWDMSKSSSKRAAAGEPDAEGNFTINWEMTLSSYAGGFAYAMENGYKLTDTMDVRAAGKENNQSLEIDKRIVKNYIPAADFANIDSLFTLKFINWTQWNEFYKKYSGVKPSDIFVVDTTVTDEDGNVKGFTLKFKKVTDTTSDAYKVISEANEITLSYESRAEGSGQLSKLNVGDKLVYNNTITFPGTPKQTAEVPLEKKAAISKSILNYDYAVYNQERYTDDNKTFDLKKLDNFFNKEKEVYTLTYKLDVNESKNYSEDDDLDVKDTLPEGMTYVSGQFSVNGGEDRYDIPVGEASTGSTGMYSVANGQEITFHVPGSVHQGGHVEIFYTVEIPLSVMEAQLAESENSPSGTAKFTNEAGLNAEFDNIGVTFEDTTPKLTKTAVPVYDDQNQFVDNAVVYTLDINPNARQLVAEGETVRIRDTINQGDDANHARWPILFSQLSTNSVKIYKFVDNEKVEMDPSEYTFETPVRKTLPVQGDTNLGNGDVYEFKIIIPDSTHISIEYTYSFEFNQQAKSGNFDVSNMVLKNKAQIEGLQSTDESEFKENFNKQQSSGAYASTVPRIVIRKVSSDNWFKSLAGAKFKLRRYDAERKVWQTLTGYEEVPSLYEWRDTEHDKETNYNKTIFGKWTDDNDLVEKDIVVLETTASGTVDLPCLQEHSTKTDSTGDVVKDSSGKPKEYLIPATFTKLADGQPKFLYEIEEIEAPTGYKFAPDEAKHYFYEQLDGSDMKPRVASEDTGIKEYQAVRSGNNLELENDKKSISVQKYWNNPDPDTMPDEITLKLYKTKTAPDEQQSYHFVTFNVKENGNIAYTGQYVVPNGATFTADIEYRGYTWCNGYSSSQNLKTLSGVNNQNVTGVIKVEGTTPVTEDTVYEVSVYNNSSAAPVLTVTSQVLNNPASGKPADSEYVKDIILTEADGWKADIELDSSDDYYYYVEEETVDGYNVNYLRNGIDDGTIELMNESYETGKLKVNKAWVGDETIDRATFRILGYTEQKTQTISDFSEQNIYNGPVVEINVVHPGKAQNSCKFPFTKGESYTVRIGGRDTWVDKISLFTINGENKDRYQYFSNNDGSDGITLYLSNTADFEDNTIINVNVSESYGLDQNWDWNNPTDDDFLFVVKDSSNVEVEKYGVDDTIMSTNIDAEKSYSPATVTKPEGTAYIERDITVYKSDGWTNTLAGLPLATADGQKIYYYVEEVGGTGYQAIDYSTNAVELNADSAKVVTVTNQGNGEVSYTLPEAGGEGTALYIITGSGIMLGCVMYFIRNKRKAEADSLK